MSSSLNAVAEVLAMRQDLLARSETLRSVRAASQNGTLTMGGAIASPAHGAPSIDFAQTLQGALHKVSAVQKRSGDMQVTSPRS